MRLRGNNIRELDQSTFKAPVDFNNEVSNGYKQLMPYSRTSIIAPLQNIIPAWA